jgi:hypothetical protein
MSAVQFVTSLGYSVLAYVVGFQVARRITRRRKA